MASIETDICNQALGRFSANAISDLGEQSAEGAACRRFYAQTRDELLRQHPWNFSIARTTLATSFTPDSQYTYGFNLPPDCLRVLTVYDYDDDWVIEQGSLLLNNDSPSIIYIARIDDCGKYPPDFVETFILKLSTKLCTALTQNWKLSSQLYQEYEIALGRAKAADAQENSPQAIDTSTVINARYGSLFG